jgi:hypothetical protein
MNSAFVARDVALAPGYILFNSSISTLDTDIPLGIKKSSPSAIGCDPVFVVVKPCALSSSWCFWVLNPLVGENPSFPRSLIGSILLPLKVTRRSAPSDLLFLVLPSY